jgi:hypothetical protein
LPDTSRTCLYYEHFALLGRWRHGFFGTSLLHSIVLVLWKKRYLYLTWVSPPDFHRERFSTLTGNPMDIEGKVQRIRRGFEPGESVHKIIHNVSWGRRSLSTTLLSPPSLQLLIQRRPSLHRYERGTARLESRRDSAKRLAFPALLRVLARMEVRFAARRVSCDRSSALGLFREDV